LSVSPSASTLLDKQCISLNLTVTKATIAVTRLITNTRLGYQSASLFIANFSYQTRIQDIIENQR